MSQITAKSSHGNTIWCLSYRYEFSSLYRAYYGGIWNSRNVRNHLHHKYSASYVEWKSHCKALRGHFLIDTALHCLLGSELFGNNLISSCEENNLRDQTSLDIENNTNLEESSKICSLFLGKTLCAETVLDHHVLKLLHNSFFFLEQIKTSRTTSLWI